MYGYGENFIGKQFGYARAGGAVARCAGEAGRGGSDGVRRGFGGQGVCGNGGVGAPCRRPVREIVLPVL